MKKKTFTVYYPDGNTGIYSTSGKNIYSIDVMTENGMYLWVIFKDGTDIKIYNTPFTVRTHY